MKEVVVATKNKGKVVEIAAALAGLPIKVISLDEFPAVPEAVEDGETFVQNAVIKARHYSRLTGKPCLADDSGLEVDALGGAPGVLSARYAGEDANDAGNNQKLLAELHNVIERTARFRCVLAFVNGNAEPILADGTCEGIILEEQRGTGGFGYDPLFYMPALGKTLAEVDSAAKNAVSHRGQALKHMAQLLAGYWQ